MEMKIPSGAGTTHLWKWDGPIRDHLSNATTRLPLEWPTKRSPPAKQIPWTYSSTGCDSETHRANFATSRHQNKTTLETTAPRTIRTSITLPKGRYVRFTDPWLHSYSKLLRWAWLKFNFSFFIPTMFNARVCRSTCTLQVVIYQ